jgi:hypothetical protein
LIQKKTFRKNWQFTTNSVLHEENYPLKQKIINTLFFTCSQLLFISSFIGSMNQSSITLENKKSLFCKIFDLVYSNPILDSVFGDFSCELSSVSSELVTYLNILL